MADLQTITKTIGRSDIVIHLEELIKAFKNGVNKYFSELSKDPKRTKMAATNAGVWFINMDKSVINNVMNIIDKLSDT